MPGLNNHGSFIKTHNHLVHAEAVLQEIELACIANPAKQGVLLFFVKIMFSRVNVRFLYIGISVISAPNRQNTVPLIFKKNELGAFLECLRPPLSIAGSIMTLAGL